MGINKKINENIYSEITQHLTVWNTSSLDYEQIFEHFADESSTIEDLITRTLTLGESNSLLLVGPRGTAKSAVLNSVLTKLKENGKLDLGFVVKLNGLLETDDRLALREIIRQLKLDGISCALGSFAENLNYILKTLQSGNRHSSKPILFLLDEFDLFCHHKNQTLLYNLFDIAQSAQAPVCVVGQTSRLDVIELLEKRVKSRFSHRQIFLYPNEKFENYLGIAKRLLTVDLTKLGKCGATWNKEVEAVFADSEVNAILKQVFCLNKDIRNLKSFLHHVMVHLSHDSQSLTSQHFRDSFATFGEDAKERILESLSILQLSLLITMKHLNEIYDGDPFNFEMVFRQYQKFGEKHSSMCSYERAVVFKAFDQLENLELIRPVDSNRSTIQREYRLMQLLVLPQQIEKTIQSTPNLPTFLSYWCSSNSV